MTVDIVTADDPHDRATLPLTLDTVAAVAALVRERDARRDPCILAGAIAAHGLNVADVLPLLGGASPEVERANRA